MTHEGKMMKNDLRSPIGGVKIRRQAGQSAMAKADALVEDMASSVAMPFLVVFFVAIVDVVSRFWGRYTIGLYVVLIAGAAVVSAWQYKRRISAVRHWKQGAAGERYVGQILDREMSAAGYKVYHDIQINKGCRQMNIDHLVVGENGVYLIEDKTWSKPLHGQTVVKYEGGMIFKNGVPRRAPVDEAFALAKEAHDYIARITGVSAHVKPVLVFVGWYNQANNRHDSPLLVLSEKVISRFLKKHHPQSVPTPQELRLIVAKLDAENT